MAIYTGTPLEQVLGNCEGLPSCFSGDSVTVFARESLSWSPYASVDGIGVVSKQSSTVILDQRLHHAFGVAMRHRPRRVIRIECERVAVRAVFVHRYWQHSSASRLGHVALTALHDPIAVRRHDAVVLEVYLVIELEIGSVVVTRRQEIHMLNLPVKTAILEFNRTLKADPEVRVIVQKVAGALQVDTFRQFGVAI